MYLVKFIKMKVGIRQGSEVPKGPKMAFSKRKNRGFKQLGQVQGLLPDSQCAAQRHR